MTFFTLSRLRGALLQSVPELSAPSTLFADQEFGGALYEGSEHLAPLAGAETTRRFAERVDWIRTNVSATFAQETR